MLHSLSHLWITAPYQEDRNISLQALVAEENIWCQVDCHQNLGGPYTGARTLVKYLVSEIGLSNTDHVTNYTKALLRLAPELRLHTITGVTDSLMEAASIKERLRFYGGNQGEYLAHTLIYFILECVALKKGLEKQLPLVLVFDNVQAADLLDQQFLAALLQRADPEVLSVVVSTTEHPVLPSLQRALTKYTQHIVSVPLTREECLQIGKAYQLSETWITMLLRCQAHWRGEWKAFGAQNGTLLAIEPVGSSLSECIHNLIPLMPEDIQLSLVTSYIQAAGTSDDLLAYHAYDLAPLSTKQALHEKQAQMLEVSVRENWALGALPYHYERGQSPMTSGVQALLLATHRCFERGFYEAVIDFGQRGRTLIDASHNLEQYWEFTKDIGQALAILRRSNEAEELYKEIRALTSDSIIHTRIDYAMAMHYTRFYPSSQRDHVAAKGWLQQALALIQLSPAGDQKLLEQAFHLNALALTEMHLGNYHESLSLVQKAMDCMQEIPGEQFVLYRTVLLANRGQLYAYLENWVEAFVDFDEAIRLDPYYDELYIKRAKIYYQSGKYEETLKDYNRGITNGLFSAELFTDRAKILSLLNRPQEALADYTTALEMNPTLTDALLNRAEIYRQCGQPEQALQDYTTGIVDGSPSFELFYNRAHLLDSMGRVEEALADYTNALKLNPMAKDVFLNRAMIFYEREDYAIAHIEVERGLQIHAHYPPLLCVQALIESARQEHEQAYHTFTLALEQDHSLVEAWTNRAIAAYELGWIEAAILDLSEALLLEENSTILANRAHAYQTQQQWEKAIADYTRSIDLVEDDAEEQQELISKRNQCYANCVTHEIRNVSLGSPASPA